MTAMGHKSAGEQLRALRKNARLSLRDVAASLTNAKVPVTHQAVSTWENGKHPVPRAAIPVLERLLSTTAGELADLFGYRLGPSPDDRMAAIEARQAAQELTLEEIRTELRAIAEALSPPPAGRRAGRR